MSRRTVWGVGVVAMVASLTMLVGQAGASTARFGKPKVTAKGVVFSIRTDEAATFTISSPGLHGIIAVPVKVGLTTFTVKLTKLGRQKHKLHRQIRVVETLKTPTVTGTSAGPVTL